jgi:hypothetical protein
VDTVPSKRIGIVLDGQSFLQMWAMILDTPEGIDGCHPDPSTIISEPGVSSLPVPLQTEKMLTAGASKALTSKEDPEKEPLLCRSNSSGTATDEVSSTSLGEFNGESLFSWFRKGDVNRAPSARTAALLIGLLAGVPAGLEFTSPEDTCDDSSSGSIKEVSMASSLVSR